MFSDNLIEYALMDYKAKLIKEWEHALNKHKAGAHGTEYEPRDWGEEARVKESWIRELIALQKERAIAGNRYGIVKIG